MRALVHRPRSYKLWYRYLMERLTECKELCIIDRRVVETNNAFERSLIFMHKMPRIWMIHCQFLTWQRFTTWTRQTFDRALMSLTQHDRIWPLYRYLFTGVFAFKNTLQGVDDLATVWCQWAEMELRHKHYDKALHGCAP